MTFILKVEANGGDFLWSNEKTFETKCGPQSAGIITENLPALVEFIIVNGSIPWFTIPKFS